MITSLDSVWLSCLLSIAGSLWIDGAAAATASQWRGRSIYQVVTDRYGLANGSTTAWCDASVGKYCGGTWKGIEGHLDYIQNMGFGGVWISPITAQLPQYTDHFSSYHGYWQQNIYELNDKFGSEDDLHDLANALHDRGMYLMVDVVVNHMAWSGDAPSVQYDRLIPFNKNEYYHDFCQLNEYSSQTDCWLGDDIVTLPDLITEHQDVKDIFNSWISTLVSTYNIDGLRLDSAGNVNNNFFKSFCEAAGIFCLGEVYSGDTRHACPYQEDMDGVMNYPIFFPLTRAFQATNGSFDDVVDMLGNLKDDCKDTTLMGVFTENHDQPRFASLTDDMSLAKNIMTFTLMSDGIPIIYQGQEQHLSGRINPLNREAIWLTDYSTDSPLYNHTATLNLFRTFVSDDSTTFLTTPATVLSNTSSILVTRKDDVVTLTTNLGSSSQSTTHSFPLTSSDSPSADGNLATGTALLDVISCKVHIVNDNGGLDVSIEDGLPMVFYERDRLSDSSICDGGQEGGITKNPDPVAMDPPPKKSDAGNIGGWKGLLLFVVFGSVVLFR